MKNPQDPRHLRRKKVITKLFCWSFHKEQKIEDELVNKIIKNCPKIDEIIAKAAPEWPVKQINKIDLAILRLAIFELVLTKKEPPKAIIDEAIELAKFFGGEKSPSFINGVLGTVLRDEKS